MRFIHTADWHLGKLFGQRHMTEDQAYVLEELLALCKDVRPTALVVAGDVYDRAIPPPEAVELFNEILTRLSEQDIRVLFIAGNHDSAVRLGFGAQLLRASGIYPAGIVRAVELPVILSDEYGDVYFSLIPYGDPPHVREAFNLDEALSFDRALAVQIAAARAQIPSAARSVAVAHAFVIGGHIPIRRSGISMLLSEQVPSTSDIPVLCSNTPLTRHIRKRESNLSSSTLQERQLIHSIHSHHVMTCALSVV